eukprot:4119771-Prorocentrum_lima.AAC.1
MPRTFDEADTGALGARFGGLSVGDQGDGVPDAVMTAQGEKVVDVPPSPNQLTQAVEEAIPKEIP